MREKYNIGGVNYYTDSITEEGSRLIESIRITDRKINDLKTDTELFQIARNSFVDSLKGILDTFEKVPETEDTEDTTGEK
jgi:hypothetical protein